MTRITGFAKIKPKEQLFRSTFKGNWVSLIKDKKVSNNAPYEVAIGLKTGKSATTKFDTKREAIKAYNNYKKLIRSL